MGEPGPQPDRDRRGPSAVPAASPARPNTPASPAVGHGAILELQRLVGNRAVARSITAPSTDPGRLESTGTVRAVAPARHRDAAVGHRAVQRSAASDLVEARTNLLNLDERGLGTDLLARARAGEHDVVVATLNELGSTDRDDVAYELCAAATDADVQAFVATPGGRRMVDRMFDELTAGSVAEEEQQQADRLLRAKTATMSPEAFARGMQHAKVFPCRLPGFTVLDDAPIMAERRGEGRVWVKLPTRVLGTAMFRAETTTLPVDTFIGGVELPEDEVVGVRMYDLGGEVVYRPALVLVQLSNEATTTVLTKIAEIVGIGLTLGTGSLVSLGVEASMAARVMLWADRAAFVLGTIASVVNEHRGELIASYGDAGRQFLRYVDYVQSATAIYGFARLALSMGQLVAGLRTAARDLRAAAASADGGPGVVTQVADDADAVVRHAEDIQGARAGAAPPRETGPTGGATDAPSATTDTPGPATPERVPEPGGPHAAAAAPGAPEMPPGFDAQGRLRRQGSRSVLNQGPEPTCGPISCAMVMDTMGQQHDVTVLVRSAGPDGTPDDVLLGLLRRSRIDADLHTGKGLGDLAAATSSRAGGNPAIAVVRNTSGTRTGEVLHAVVVDGVTTRMGQQVVAIRDPWGIQYFELASVFAARFTGRCIFVNFSFSP